MAVPIEKNVTLDAPVGRVWEALTDHRQFGDWFGVLLDGPFEAGKTSRGRRLPDAQALKSSRSAGNRALQARPIRLR